MGSLMPAMAGVAERLVPCRVAAMPLARSVVVAGECPLPAAAAVASDGKPLVWKESKNKQTAPALFTE